ncbi:MAG: hypothetical protein JG777_1011, partial [Clostridia bacterium]|nr:hypothetical protein [Clostridia bacterium]
SHPARVRGLKQKDERMKALARVVAPRTGAWIETKFAIGFNWPISGRTPHGCVD